ncbi:MAG TPA: hypothetical protein VMA77_28485 [Solirubrobacteraceae bacterium]|nr:hypothetical protein [Solirubrobacteraceae bacterium]
MNAKALVVMRSTADGAPHHAEHREYQPDYYQDDANCPQDRDLGDEANDQEYYSECYH